MNDPRNAAFAQTALSRRLSRRAAVAQGLGLGLAAPGFGALVGGTHVAAAAPALAARDQLFRNQEGAGGTFTALILSGAEDIDPHSSYSTLGSVIGLGVYEMLIQYKGDSTSEYDPMLAESWEAAPDNTSVTFTLSAGAMFHDGTACDAEAVKYSFTRFLEMGLGPVNVISRFVQSPDQMEVVDAQTIRFNFERPQPLFLAAMASSYGPYVVSPVAVEEHKTEDDPYANLWFMSNAVGTGPYRLTENSINERVVMEQFDEYHGGWDGSHFDEVVLRVVAENATRRQLIENGEADAITNNLTYEDLDALRENPDLEVLEYDTTHVNWVIMNAVRMNVEARQGFSYAFPYDDVISGVYNDLLKRSGPIPDTVKAHDPEVFLYQTDLARAKELILAGGFAEGDTFDYVVAAGDEVDKSIAQLFQANLTEIGFNLEVAEVDLATMDGIVFGNQPVEEKPTFISWAWWPDYNDPWNQLQPNFTEAAIGEGGSNAGGWVHPRFEEIMAEAEHYTDEAQLVALIQEAQNILTEQDPPAIYYGQLKYFTVLQQNIEGFVANPLYLYAYPFYQMSRA